MPSSIQLFKKEMKKNRLFGFCASAQLKIFSQNQCFPTRKKVKIMSCSKLRQAQESFVYLGEILIIMFILNTLFDLDHFNVDHFNADTFHVDQFDIDHS